MVASDTVVGLIGAGVLVVALVGVFLIESRPVPEKEGPLSASTGLASAAGTIMTGGSGGGVNNPVTNQRVCDVPTAPCYEPFTNIDITITGLPQLPSDGGISYTVFLQSSSDTTFGTQNYGVLKFQGGAHKLTMNETSGAKAGGRSADRMVLTVETVANPTVPSNWVILNSTLTPSQNPVVRKPVSGSGTVDLTMGGAGTATLQEADNGLQVAVTLESAHHFNMSEYRVWIRSNGTNTYSYVGSITEIGPNGHVRGSASRVFPDANFGNVEQVFVVLSSTSQAPPNPGTALPSGQAPQGAVVFQRSFA